MRKVVVNNAYEINVRVGTGQGPAVLLIHGLAGDHTAWNTLIGELEGRFRVVAPDNRGAGKSTQLDEPITIRNMAMDMLELMDRLEIERFHVVGRSMGGCIAQEMYFAAPERIQSIAMLASCARCDETQKRSMINMREALLWRGSWTDHARHSVLNFVSHKFFNENQDRMAAIEAIIASETRLQASYVAQSTAVQAHDVLDRLSSIQCPVLIAHGGRDPLGSPTGTQWMIDRLPHAEVECFTQSSHFFFMEEPERFSRMMNDWLDRQVSAGARS
jgi:3-oxoadipate enol-lactonase